MCAVCVCCIAELAKELCFSEGEIGVASYKATVEVIQALLHLIASVAMLHTAVKRVVLMQSLELLLVSVLAADLHVQVAVVLYLAFAGHASKSITSTLWEGANKGLHLTIPFLAMICLEQASAS